MPIQLAILEDNPLLQTALTRNLELFSDLSIQLVASRGEELLEGLKNNPVDCILMDIHVPGMDGIETTRLVSEEFPQIRIIMQTVFDESEKVFQSILAGAVGYLMKDEKPERFHEAILDAMEGGSPMSPAIAMKVLTLLKEKSGQPTGGQRKDFQLSARELEILNEISLGQGYQQIASKLFISPKTVRKHIENIYRKLQVNNKVDAVKIAMKNNLIQN